MEMCFERIEFRRVRDLIPMNVRAFSIVELAPTVDIFSTAKKNLLLQITIIVTKQIEQSYVDCLCDAL